MVHAASAAVVTPVWKCCPSTPEIVGPPGLANYRTSTPSPTRSNGERDVFFKFDKCLPSLPTIDFALWKIEFPKLFGFSDLDGDCCTS